MIKIKILSVGKNKESWLEQALSEYVKRLKPIANIEFTWTKDDQQLLEMAQKEPLIICLDANGQSLNSEQFANFLQTKIQQGGTRIAFIIGGAEGLPEPLKNKHTASLISLSPMTFTHQIARLVLLEQIYRSFEIAKGSQYHK